MNSRSTVTSFGFFALIVGVVIGNGIFSLPRVVTAEAGRSAWISIIIAGVLFTILALLSNYVASRFPDKDPADWSKMLLGAIGGRIWLALYFLRAVATAILTAQLYASIVTVRILVATPSTVVAWLLIILSIYAVITKLTTLVRFANLTFYYSLPLLLLVLIVLPKGLWINVRPAIGDVGFAGILRGVLPAAYSFVGFDIIWFAYPYLAQKRRSSQGVMLAMGFITAVYLIVVVTALSFFGLEWLQTIIMPTLSMLSIGEFVVVERTDSLALYVYLGTIVVTCDSQLYIAVRSVQGIAPKLSVNKITLIIGGIALFLSRGSPPQGVINNYAEFLGTFDIIFFVLSIVLFMVLSSLKGARRK